MTTRRSNTNRTNEAEHIRQTRTEQLSQIRTILASLEPRLQEAVRPQRKQLNLLDSVSQGLYEEVDKLAKKAPAEPVTDLVLGQMNELIRETKELVTDDPYVQRLQEFVPAGDNPQHRDAVVVLRQVRQGLARFRQQLDPVIKQLNSRLMNAKGIEVALQLWLAGNTAVQKDELADYEAQVSESWLTGIHPQYFDFDKLDRVNLAAYLGDTE